MINNSLKNKWYSSKMGIEYSVFDILNGIRKEEEEYTTTDTDGRKISIKRKNPWVTGILVVSVTGIFLVYLDGGKGTISKSCGKVCINCSKPITPTIKQ